jgi:cell division protein FtsI/penicillin-binding protein 2
MNYIASFVGFVPADKPVLSMIVVLDNPKKENFIYGGKVAAPVFRDIARQVLRYLKVPPEAGRMRPVLASGPRTGGAP